GYKEENMNKTIRNGLENEWKVLQTIEQNKKNLCIANADTFIFLEDDDDQPKYIQQRDQQKKHPHSKKNIISLFQSINRVRHLVFTTSMRLEPFPIKKKPFIMSSFQYTTPLNRERDGEVAGPGLSEIERRGRIQLPEYVPSFLPFKGSKSRKILDDNLDQSHTRSEIDNSNSCSCTTAIALVDQPAGTSAVSLLFDFEHHRVSLHSFVVAALPPQASRLMLVLDENRTMKTLKGENISIVNRVHTGDVNIVKGALAKNNDFVKDYYQKGLDSIREIDEINNINIENENSSNLPLSPNSISSQCKKAYSRNTAKQSNQQSTAMSQLYKHICNQQFKLNTFIITFPNRNMHKPRKKGPGHDDNTSNDESQITSTTGTESTDNTENSRLAINLNQLSDDEETLIFQSTGQGSGNSLLVNEPIFNFYPFLIITSYAVGFLTSHLTLLKFVFQIPFTEPPMSCLYAGGQEKDIKRHSDPYYSNSDQDSLKLQRRHRQSRDLRSVDKLFIGAGKALIIIANGQSQFHFYPYKWFNELAMT
ncbi:MAG: hypothetical protein EZS28_042964, partial [Streblomastix strix]